MACVKIACIILVFGAVCALAENEPPKKYSKDKGQIVLQDENEDKSYETKKPSLKRMKMKTPRKPLLSAWGIIFLLMSLFCLAMAGYYFYLFYPIYFKKPRQYDNIELVTVKV